MSGIQAITVIFDGRTITVEGRQAWALKELIAAGTAGCTPITHPGPGWSDYVFKLRRQGLVIETVTETHGGVYAGHHARYVLRSPVSVIRDARRSMSGTDADKINASVIPRSRKVLADAKTEVHCPYCLAGGA